MLSMRKSKPLAASRRKFIKAGGVASIAGFAGCLGSGGGGGTGSGSSGGDGWMPDRNLTVIVPWGAGGGTDTMTRSVMKPAEKILKERGVNVNITVQNITGANGLNGARRVLNMPADGYTLFASTQAIAPNIALDNAGFSLGKWAGVARVQHDTSWIFSSGRNGVGHNSIDSLLKKAKGDGIQLGANGGVTGAAFLIQFAQAAGIMDGIQIVPYQDAGRLRTDVISGELDAALGEIQEIQSAYEAGDASLLLVGTKEPVKGFKDATAAGERDWDAYYGVSRGFNAKAGTPTKALDYWEQLVKEAMQSDSYQKLEQETLLYLRKGFLPRKEFMKILEHNKKLYNDIQEAYQKATQ
jgi:putative tricarboxylic transport membrane protein